ncbi:hypothetical protein D5018_00450 [Parashewanella curva]|uniref:Uncharacterized protein n=1 Tax=Parashewanella curva TaxID=2338552 RepID=A0A3L8Q3F7_9GAMM|nr:hypothetical protein [Parashewanella curva]RLV61623.1 hypothetical protein D5018_00450 [Parashewanella curva]
MSSQQYAALNTSPHHSWDNALDLCLKSDNPAHLGKINKREWRAFIDQHREELIVSFSDKVSRTYQLTLTPSEESIFCGMTGMQVSAYFTLKSEKPQKGLNSQPFKGPDPLAEKLSNSLTDAFVSDTNLRRDTIDKHHPALDKKVTLPTGRSYYSTAKKWAVRIGGTMGGILCCPCIVTVICCMARSELDE